MRQYKLGIIQEKDNDYNDISANKLIWIGIILIVGILPIVEILLSPRHFRSTDDVFVQGSYINILNNVKTLLNLMVLGVSYLAIISNFRRFKQLTSSIKYLVVTFLLFKIAVIISSVFGIVPNFSINLLVVPSLFLAVVFLPPMKIDLYMKCIKLVLLIYLYGSLISLVFFPSFALETNYSDGYIFSVRLFGIAIHANVLAPILTVYLIIENYWRSRRWRLINISLALILLFLTQSKTILLVGIILFYMYKLYRRWVSGSERSKLLFISLMFFLGSIITFSTFIFIHNINNIFGHDEVTALTTLTGRTEIWNYTVEHLWKPNPFFGYGPTAWSSNDMRLDFFQSYGFSPGSAHNQILQTLAEAGLFGVLGLLLYTIVLFRISYRLMYVTRGLSLILFLLLIFRGITEVPLRDNLSDNNLIIHFIIFSLLVLLSQSEQKVLVSKDIMHSS